MDLLEVFRDSADVVEFSAGSVIFEEGTDAEFMYVILEGEIKLSLHGQAIATADPGTIVGEMALLNSDVRSATATAMADCRLVPIDVHSFESLIQYTPDFALHVMIMLADRLRKVNEALSGLSAGEGL